MRQVPAKRFYSELPFFLMLPALIWQLLFFLIPLAIVVWLSLFKAGSLSLANYASLMDMPHLKIVLRSLLYAFCNATICLLFAYPVTYFISRKAGSFKNVLLFFIMLPFGTNILVQIYAWFFVLERNGVINSLFLKLGLIDSPLNMVNNPVSVLAVMAYAYMPFMILPLFNTLEKIDQRLIESSYDLGANRWQTFFKIMLPLSSSGIKTGFFLVFVPSFGEFVIPALMGGSKYMFVGSLISHYYLTVQNIFQGSAFTVVSGLILLTLALGCNFYFGKRAQPGKEQ